MDRLGLVGQTIDGRYTINTIIGEGGVGAVYRAEHRRLGRTVAIKFLHREYAQDQEALQRFFNEARAAATLGHMNIAESIDMGELSDGAPYLVLEFLDGRSLADAIQHAGPISVRRSLRIARQITCGLEVAHEHGIIHRDLKSENVFLTHRDDNPEHVKILDFGVARMLGRPSPTKPGHLVGTPDFMPPEQIADPDNIDERVDVYAAGVILYQMLSGRKPWGDALPINTLLHRILHEDPQPLPDTIPLEVRKLVNDAMARDPANRIESMVALRERIDQLAPGQPTPFPTSTARPPVAMPQGTPQGVVAVPLDTAIVPSTPAPTASRDHRRLIAIAAPLLVACVIGGYVLLRKTDTPSTIGTTAAPTTPSVAPTSEPSAPVIPNHPRVVGPDPSLGIAHPTQAAAPPTQPPHAIVPATTVPRSTTHQPTPPARVATDLKPASIATAAPTQPPVSPPATVTAPAATTPPPVAGVPVAPAPVHPPTAAPAAPPKLDVVALRKAMAPKLGSIQECFERSKMEVPDLQGTVVMKIQLAPDGAVTSAQVTSSTLGSPSVEQCMIGVISHWHLPGSGVAAAFNYPFAFH